MNYLPVFKKAFQGFQNDKASRLGAALAYYTAFSLAPLLVVTLTIVGSLYRSPDLQQVISNQIGNLVGPTNALFITSLLSSSSSSQQGSIALVIGGLATLLGAISIFAQLKDAANTIWKVEPPKLNGIVGWLRTNLFSFGLLLATAFLLLASLVITTLLASVGTMAGQWIPFSPFLLELVNGLISILIISLLLSLLLKFLPDTEVSWKSAIQGGIITALLFLIGKYALSFYLGSAGTASTFGAAGSLAAILIWLYYASQILLFGIEVSRVLNSDLPIKVKASTPSPDQKINIPRLSLVLGLSYLLIARHKRKKK